MKSFKIALIGEGMVELQEISTDVTKQTFGGDTLNTAIYCARLARDLPLKIDYLTALGTDTFSGKMISFWEQEGIGSELTLREQGKMPGLYYIELDDRGERVFHYWRSAAAVKKCFEYPASGDILNKLIDYDGIYLSGISLAVLTPTSRAILFAKLNELADNGVSIYFDCNYRPHLWASRELAIEEYNKLYSISNIVFLTTEEADILLDGARGNNVHTKLNDMGAREIVLKNGNRPCTIFSDNKFFEVEAETVQNVIDTTAAGDSFSAVYLVARLFGCSPAIAAKMAHKTAAYVIRHRGAVAPVDNMPITGKDVNACTGNPF